MLDRKSKRGRPAALLTAGLLALTLITGSATTRATFEIIDSDKSYVVTGHTGETAAALEAAGVRVSGRDKVEVSQGEEAVRLTVRRPTVTYEDVWAEALPYETVRREDPGLALGEERVIQIGAAGTAVERTRVVTDPDGAVRRYGLGRVVTEQPVNEIVAYGTKVEAVPASWLSVSGDVLTNIDANGAGGGVLTTASGQRLRYSRALECVATAYTTERQSWKKTATGTTARVGAIAVDPRVIPYGTKMYIVSADGSITYGVATAEDCGSGVQGKRVDLFFNTYNECINFGVRDCDVYILE